VFDCNEFLESMSSKAADWISSGDNLTPDDVISIAAAYKIHDMEDNELLNAVQEYSIENATAIMGVEAVKLAYLFGENASTDFMECLDRIIGNEIHSLEGTYVCDAFISFTQA
jgi:type III secretion system FlhB-like substrate exporter